jgi:hypothetical protein
MCEAWPEAVQLKMRAALLGGIHQHRVRTASGSDRILRATQHKLLFRKLLFDPVATSGWINQGRSNQRGGLHDPVATARGSDTIRGDSHI